tara:strand:- start:4678 stop:6759 length:2082 start_codon:yes stop_codon:yes gene_type:complete
MSKQIKSWLMMAAVGGAFAVSPVVHAEDKLNTFDYNDIFELEYAASPQLAPDGASIVYVRRSANIMKDSARSNIWQVGLDGKDHRPLLSGKANFSMPRFSRDGKRLAYVSSVEGSQQLYVRWMDTGQTARLTDLQTGFGNISWSPDGKWIAFSMLVKDTGSNLFKDMPAKPEGATWAEPAKYIDRVQYRSNGAGFLPHGYRHIFVVPADGGTARQITTGNYNHGGSISWSNDSQNLYVSADRHDDWEYRPLESDIYQIRLADGEISNLTNRPGPDSQPVVSPTGKHIAYARFDDRKLASQNADLFVMDRDGGNPRNLTPDLDRSISNIQWAKDGKGVYFLYDDHSHTKVGYVNLKGNMKVLTDDVGGQSLGRPYTSGDYTVAGKGQVVFTLGKTDRPADLALVDGKGAVRQLTALNEDLLGHKNLASVSRMTVKSSVDQREIEAWIATPPGFDQSKKYPLILEIHGGPHAAYSAAYSTEIQMYAANGYVVVWANPRGSTSYGEEFANLIHHDYPSHDYDDLMDVVDGVVAKGYVDPDQLFVTGGSGGGVLTAWIVGKTDRFRAAVVAKPVINWLSFALTADMSVYASQYWMPGMPWENVDHLWKHSPLSLVGNVKTPTMLLTGEVDYRTPMSETEQYYQALKLQKIDAAMVRIQGANHGIAAKPSNLIQKIGNVLAWFDKYKPEEPSPDEGQE